MAVSCERSVITSVFIRFRLTRQRYLPHHYRSTLLIDREFEFYEYISFLKFDEFLEFFSVEQKFAKNRNFANHRCSTCFDVLECNVHL